jgi:hypothetical protein
VDELLKDYREPGDLLGESGIIKCLRYVPWKESWAGLADLKLIYQAATLAEAEAALDACAAK